MPATFDVLFSNGERTQFRDDEWPIVWGDWSRIYAPPNGLNRQLVLREHDDDGLLVHGWTWPAASSDPITSVGEMFQPANDRSMIEAAVNRIAAQIEYPSQELQNSLKEYLDQLFDAQE